MKSDLSEMGLSDCIMAQTKEIIEDFMPQAGNGFKTMSEKFGLCRSVKELGTNGEHLTRSKPDVIHDGPGA